jgi:hypothetical protein
MQQVIRILLHGSINICYGNQFKITPVLLMINIVGRTILQYTSTLEVVGGRGGDGRLVHATGYRNTSSWFDQYLLW